ncbi:MAG: hypothetical protein SV062_12475 [Thermodesulfobacteriota bacterium]|nr:hypothetical protein [Thermodesulfobacteriota bacterium]
MYYEITIKGMPEIDQELLNYLRKESLFLPIQKEKRKIFYRIVVKNLDLSKIIAVIENSKGGTVE